MIKKVTLEDLKKDTYQRPVSEAHVKKLVKDWNPSHVGFITVGSRNGSLFVIDGQHRIEAAKRIGFSELLADVRETSGVEEEASIWRAMNVAPRKPTAIDAYYNDFAGGVSDAVEIHEFLASNGISVPRFSKGGFSFVCFISGLRNAWHRNSDAAKEAIRLMLYIRGDHNLEGQIFLGLWYLLDRGVDVSNEKDRLLANGGYARMLRGVKEKAYSTIHGAMRSAMIVLDAINYKKQKRIQMPIDKRHR